MNTILTLIKRPFFIKTNEVMSREKKEMTRYTSDRKFEMNGAQLEEILSAVLHFNYEIGKQKEASARRKMTELIDAQEVKSMTTEKLKARCQKEADHTKALSDAILNCISLFELNDYMKFIDEKREPPKADSSVEDFIKLVKRLKEDAYSDRCW